MRVDLQDVKQAKEKTIKIRNELLKGNLLMLLTFLVVIGKVNLADYLKTNLFYLLFYLIARKHELMFIPYMDVPCFRGNLFCGVTASCPAMRTRVRLLHASQRQNGIYTRANLKRKNGNLIFNFFMSGCAHLLALL